MEFFADDCSLNCLGDRIPVANASRVKRPCEKA